MPASHDDSDPTLRDRNDPVLLEQKKEEKCKACLHRLSEGGH